MEEHKNYIIEHGSEINWFDLHTVYHRAGLGHILSDIDVVFELDNEVIFLEFKNYDLSPNPVEFSEVNTVKKNLQIARKYYDSYLTVNTFVQASTKKKRYFFVLVHGDLDVPMRSILYEKIRKQLPFRIFDEITELNTPLINEFRIMDIEGWNARFPDFKLQKV